MSKFRFLLVALATALVVAVAVPSMAAARSGPCSGDCGGYVSMTKAKKKMRTWAWKVTQYEANSVRLTDCFRSSSSRVYCSWVASYDDMECGGDLYAQHYTWGGT